MDRNTLDAGPAGVGPPVAKAPASERWLVEEVPAIQGSWKLPGERARYGSCCANSALVWAQASAAALGS